MTPSQRYITKVAQKYDYSSTQVDLPAEQAAIVRRMAADIPESDVVERETTPHITIKYGLHTTDPKPVDSALKCEPPISVKFGRTEVFETPDHDVVHVKVLSPDLRRLNAKLKRLLPHTETNPRYQPHVTVAYVKKGRGHRYAGRGDLEHVTVVFEAAKFCKPSGRKTAIPLSKAAQLYGEPAGWKDYLSSSPALMAAGGLGGAGVGRYLIAPVLARILGLDPERARSSMTMLGAGAGILPGLLMGLARHRLKGSFFAPGGPPRNDAEGVRYMRSMLGAPSPGYHPYHELTGTQPFAPKPAHVPQSFDVPLPGGGSFNTASVAKRASMADPRMYSPALWKPTFPVLQSMDEVTQNPLIPLGMKVKMRQLIAESGQQQGVGLTGLASPGALMAALPRVIGHAVPTVGAAWVASELLGAPRAVKNTALGAALVYSALKGFMEKGSSSEKPPEGYTLHEEEDENGGKLWKRRTVLCGDRKVGFLTENPEGDQSVSIRGLFVGPEHRGKGLAKYLLAVSASRNAGRKLKLAVGGFKDKPMSDAQLTRFYESAGFRRDGDGKTLSKVAARTIEEVDPCPSTICRVFFSG